MMAAKRLAPGGTLLSGPDAPEGDAELVLRAQAGDRWAEDTLFRRHAQALYALLCRLLRDPVEAEDALQDTLMLAIRDLGGLNDPGAVAPWLRRLAVNRAHRRFRQRWWRRQVPAEGLEGLAASGASPEVRAELAAVDRAVGSLSPALQTGWLLRFVEGYTLEEVAELCGCSLATAKRRLAKADALMQARLRGGNP